MVTVWLLNPSPGPKIAKDVNVFTYEKLIVPRHGEAIVGGGGIEMLGVHPSIHHKVC